jgi:hypothetical protein
MFDRNKLIFLLKCLFNHSKPEIILRIELTEWNKYLLYAPEKVLCNLKDFNFNLKRKSFLQFPSVMFSFFTAPSVNDSYLCDRY